MWIQLSWLYGFVHLQQHIIFASRILACGWAAIIFSHSTRDTGSKMQCPQKFLAQTCLPVLHTQQSCSRQSYSQGHRRTGAPRYSVAHKPATCTAAWNRHAHVMTMGGMMSGIHLEIYPANRACHVSSKLQVQEVRAYVKVIKLQTIDALIDTRLITTISKLSAVPLPCPAPPCNSG